MQRPATASTRVRLMAPVRAAIYARVSSDQQAERHTIDSQVEALLARAAADGHEVAAELRFLDDGHSGASLIRPPLERLRDLAAMAAIDLIYVHAPDRLARSYAHQAVLLEEFARAGAEVVFLNRPIGETPEDTLLLQLQGMFAEYERTRIIERSRRGKRHLAQAGVVGVLTRAPFGYRYVGREAGGGTARFEVVEDKAAVVRRIFRWVGLERVSLATVSRRLFEAGVPSPTGKPRWSRSMIGVLLSNTAYIGQARFGKNAPVPWRPPLRPPRGRAPIPRRPSRQVSAPPEQWIAIPVPALIEAALFEGAQAQLAENRRRNRRRAEGVRYLLQGLLVCQACGYAFCGRWQACHTRAPGHGHHYYRCTGTEKNRFDGQRRCDARPVLGERLDTAVWTEVRRLLADPARVTEEYQRRLRAVRTGPRRPELETVERQLAKLRGGVGRLIDSYAEGVIGKAEFEPRLAGLRQRVAKLEAEAAALQDAAEQARSLQLVVGKLQTFAALVRGQLDGADWNTRRDLIRTLVRRIEVDDQHVRVVFRVGPGPQGGTGSRRIPQHCPGRHRTLALRRDRRRARRGGAERPVRADGLRPPMGGRRWRVETVRRQGAPSTEL
jgi:site-specific DNA recombinase